MALAALVVNAACASRISVVSQPPEAELYVVHPGTGERKPIGKTPAELTLAEVEKAIDGKLSDSRYLELHVEKNGYQQERYFVPVNRFGLHSVSVNAHMMQGARVEGAAESLVKRLLKAQKYVGQGNHDDAIKEIDTVLNQYPRFSRALSMKASIYFVLGKFEDARKWYEEAVSADPGNEEAVQMVSKVMRAQGIQPATPGQRTPASGPGGKGK